MRAIRLTLLVHKSWQMISSLDTFVKLWACSAILTAEDFFCAPQELIREDIAHRAAQQGIPCHDLALLTHDDVLPPAMIARRDGYEANYKDQFDDMSIFETLRGRPVWDLSQSFGRCVSQSPHFPTMLPRATLYSSSLKGPSWMRSMPLFNEWCFPGQHAHVTPVNL